MSLEFQLDQPVDHETIITLIVDIREIGPQEDDHTADQLITIHHELLTAMRGEVKMQDGLPYRKACGTFTLHLLIMKGEEEKSIVKGLRDRVSRHDCGCYVVACMYHPSFRTNDRPQL